MRQHQSRVNVHGCSREGVWIRFSEVRLLVIGGTQFVGRALVTEAARRGHEVTIFHRGNVEPDDLPVVDHVHGDRHEDLALVGTRSWNAVVDTHAYFPRDVREAAAALGHMTSHYALVSTTAVHPDDLPDWDQQRGKTELNVGASSLRRRRSSRSISAGRPKTAADRRQRCC
jgi:uncharacterized protein YbjT (DUF2867 family)